MSSSLRSWLVGAVLIGSAGLALALRPTPLVGVGEVNLERQIPTSFGQWREVRSGQVQIDVAPRDENGQQEANMTWPYDQTLTRAYAGPNGEVVMLALAWGSKQRQEIKIHRPELCYSGQGFHVTGKSLSLLTVGQRTSIITTRLVTQAQARTELVTYWVRIGSEISSGAWDSRLRIFREGLKGRIPDGILVRVSQIVPSESFAAMSFAVQDMFLQNLVDSVDLSGRRLLTGS